MAPGDALLLGAVRQQFMDPSQHQRHDAGRKSANDHARYDQGSRRRADRRKQDGDRLDQKRHAQGGPEACPVAEMPRQQRSNDRAEAVEDPILRARRDALSEPPRHEIYNVGITMSYDLDLFGGIRRGIEAASARDEAVVAARDLVRVNVAAETARAYADLCNAGNQIEVLKRVILVQQRSLALTQQLITHGRAASFDQARQQGPIEGSRSQLAPLQARQLNAAFRLATLMGKPPEQYDRSLLACHTSLTLQVLLPTGDGRALLQRRPDVRAAERWLAASTADVGVATAALYPDIMLGATIGSTGAASSAFGPLTNRFAVGPLVSWDLHRSAVRDRISAAQAQTRASLANFDSTVLVALRETETSLDTYAGALNQLQRLKAARDQAMVVNKSTSELRRGGKVGGLVALDAERTWVNSEAAVASAEAEVNGDQINTFLALGGGWQ